MYITLLFLKYKVKLNFSFHFWLGFLFFPLLFAHIHSNLYIYIYIYMHTNIDGFHWSSFAIHPYQLLHLIGPQGGILYLHRAGEMWIYEKEFSTYKFILTSPVCLVCLTWMVCVILCSLITAVLWDTASRIYSKQYTASLCCSHLITPSILLRVQVVQLFSSTDSATAWKKSHIISFERSDFHMISNHSITVHLIFLQYTVCVCVCVCVCVWILIMQFVISINKFLNISDKVYVNLS